MKLLLLKMWRWFFPAGHKPTIGGAPPIGVIAFMIRLNIENEWAKKTSWENHWFCRFDRGLDRYGVIQVNDDFRSLAPVEDITGAWMRDGVEGP